MPYSRMNLEWEKAFGDDMQNKSKLLGFLPLKAASITFEKFELIRLLCILLLASVE